MRRTPSIPVQTGVAGGAANAALPAPKPLPRVGDIVLVCSGKGGVGKSTVAVNLACVLAARGRRVGLADADLHGPSVTRMLGAGATLERAADGRLRPPQRHGVASLSVADLLPPEAGLAWKGPLVAQAVLQLFHEVAWPELDMLVVDTPPGTGDVALTLLEQLPIAGAVVVTTPQKLAVIDAERGIAMFHQRDIPVFGLVENMDGYICPCCGEHQTLFPSGEARRLAERTHVAHLGSVPLDVRAQECADHGRPMVTVEPHGAVGVAMAGIADGLQAALEIEHRARAREADEAVRSQQQAFWERLLDEP